MKRNNPYHYSPAVNVPAMKRQEFSRSLGGIIIDSLWLNQQTHPTAFSTELCQSYEFLPG